MKIHHEHCPLCEQKSGSSFLQTTDYSISKETFTIEKCGNCQFKYTQDVADQQHIGKYYQSEDYVSHSNTSKGIINTLYHMVRRYMLGKKWRLLKKYHQGTQLLDVGCGTGHFLNFTQNKGYQVTGIEQDPGARKFAQEQFNITAHDTQLIDRNENLKKFEIITLWHVLEHVHDLKGYMSWFHKNLVDDGVLIIAVPNAGSWDACHYGKFWAAYDVPRHLWHFSASTMAQLAQLSGFKIIKTHRMPFDAYYNAMLSEKYQGNGPLISLIKGLVIGAWVNWRSLWNKNGSSSMIYVMQKSNA